MKSIFEVLKQGRSQTSAKSERASIVKQFFDELVLERRFDNYRRFINGNRKLKSKGKMPLTPEQFKKTNEYLKPLQARLIAIKIAHLSLSDLYYFLSVCNDAKNRGQSFSKRFFGSIKVSKTSDGSVKPKIEPAVITKLSPIYI